MYSTTEVSHHRFGGSSCGYSSENNAIKERVSSESIFTMNSSNGFTSAIQTRNRTGLTHNLGIFIDLQSSHGVVDNGSDDGNVEIVRNIKRSVGEEFFSVRAFFVFSDLVVGLESFLKVVRRASNFLCKLGTGLKVFHKASVHVVFAVPDNFTTGFSI